VSIVIGIVVGVSLYKAPALVFGSVGGPWAGMAVWVLGGALALVGALCYAELGSTYPRSGGDYAYLTLAYAPWLGFLFGWAQLVAILTGSIGALAYVFADYAVALGAGSPPALYASVSVAALTVLNLFGVGLGRSVQNALTLAKVAGLAAILGAGLLASGAPADGPPAVGIGGGGLGFALILVMYAYGGWNDAAFIAADVREPQRNVPRILLLGTGSIAVLYLLVNAAYLAGLGFDGLRASAAPAADVLVAALGPWGGRAMSALVMISALGAINGLIFTGSRIYASVGADHKVFAALGRWSSRSGAPVRALLAQCGVAVALILGVGTATGRALLDAGIGVLGTGALPWDRFGGGFDTLVAGTRAALARPGHSPTLPGAALSLDPADLLCELGLHAPGERRVRPGDRAPGGPAALRRRAGVPVEPSWPDADEPLIRDPSRGFRGYCGLDGLPADQPDVVDPDGARAVDLELQRRLEQPRARRIAGPDLQRGPVVRAVDRLVAPDHGHAVWRAGQARLHHQEDRCAGLLGAHLGFVDELSEAQVLFVAPDTVEVHEHALPRIDAQRAVAVARDVVVHLSTDLLDVLRHLAAVVDGHVDEDRVHVSGLAVEHPVDEACEHCEKREYELHAVSLPSGAGGPHVAFRPPLRAA
jgi:L-asparagine transporter-like permease